VKFKIHFAGVIVLATALCFSALRAEPVNIESARKAALRQAEIMNHRAENAGCLHSTCAIASAAKPIYDENGREALAYVFDLSPQGFVVISGDNDLPPVIAYSEHGSFCWDEHPENILLHMLREDLRLRLEAVELMDKDKIERYYEQWQGMIAGDEEFLDPGDSWPPAGQTWSGGWVESVWHQSAPYNDKCPIDPIDEVRCYTGCPATAMAQIINFWQYPDSVIFTEDDSYVSNYAGRVIPIDAPAASMPAIDYNNGSPSFETAAELSYACGVSIQSVYSSQGSGVFTNSVCADAFLNHFDFTSADFRDSDGGDFYDVMEQNIKDSMPAIIVIVWSFKPGGHTLVCDGLRDGEAGGDPQWHLNFGYGASQPDPIASAWYVIPDELPYEFDIVYEGVLNIESPRRPEPARIIEEPTVEGITLICLNPSSTIRYWLSEPGKVKLDMWDASGRLVRTLADCCQVQGSYSISWDGRDNSGARLPEGVYFARLETNQTALTAKLLLVR
jgi:hypothetical protein